MSESNIGSLRIETQKRNKFFECQMVRICTVIRVRRNCMCDVLMRTLTLGNNLPVLVGGLLAPGPNDTPRTKYSTSICQQV